MKKLLVTLSSIVVAVALFTVVAYGSSWMNFNGEGQLDQSALDVEQILEILDQVHTDKITSEEALEELKAMDPHGLLAENKQLKDDIEGLETDVANLSDENETLKTDNATLTTDLNSKISKVESLETTVDDLNGTIAGLKADVKTHEDTIAAQSTQITNLTNQNTDLEKPHFHMPDHK